MSPKPKYRLQALLLIKQRLRKKAEIALAYALKALVDARKRLKELEEERARIVKQQREARAEMNKLVNAGAFVGEGNVHVNFMRKLKEDLEAKDEEIEDQKRVVEEKKDGVALARREYIDAAKELQVMEKHKELWEKKMRHEISRREQREMDELGNTIHQLRRWRGERSPMEA